MSSKNERLTRAATRHSTCVRTYLKNTIFRFNIFPRLPIRNELIVWTSVDPEVNQYKVIPSSPSTKFDLIDQNF